MRKNHCYKFYAKYLVGKCRVFSGLSPPLYIDRHLSLPSLCEASHNDGWGEELFYRPIRTEKGEIYIGFWDTDNNDDLFIKTEEEFRRDCLGGSQIGQELQL